MTDVFDKEKRSEIMSKVRSKNTGPEMILRKALYHEGLRGYRICYKVPGKPDIAFTKSKIAIFVDGCFWHSCPECNRNCPSSNTEFWRNKITTNKERDKRVNEKLEELGWTTIRIWEHSIYKNLDECVSKILLAIRQKQNDMANDSNL